MAKDSRAVKLVKMWEREGWEFDGDLVEALDLEGDKSDKTMDFDNYQFVTISLAFKRRRTEPESVEE